MKLMLGVVDAAYSDDQDGKTTGEVAGYLENEYHVMRTFLELYEERIGEFLADAMAGEIESLAQGKPVAIFGRDVDTQLGDRVISGMSVNGRIEEAFRDYLDACEWQGVSLQRVQAADDGVNHRKKRPYANANPARPAFVDSGLYQAAFRAWTESSD
ncbi:hypothetical protein [Burkholderia lata]|uniref:Uncharacterized protein n=1 Tax=Burkholderia lata (strain ATCC 17760 / DSM 23089 / LMG 22485 / NCIMB 9086 / R18194 / 383) TaxID=482957 RepID=A0A6P2GRQ6_BURL3|nr:hypothetical protein [Burkholderia lata]VWB07208.1 hypothetical protein BLA6863_00155 [Burkholderia lata]